MNKNRFQQFHIQFKTIVTVFLFSLSVQVFAQPYGNEWINYNQSYFKIKVFKEGIYRINYATLQNAGVPIGNIDPRSFQLFNNGIEQHIYVQNENTGTFSSSDYIEFYATRNDGALDAQLYNVSGTHANPYYSLFNDTAVYFFTWTSSINNNRLLPENDVNFGIYTPLPYFYNVVHQNYTSTYFNGETTIHGSTDAEYIVGEGWFDAAFGKGSNLPSNTTKTIPTPQIFTNGPNAQINFVVVGASSPPHHLKVSFADILIDTIYQRYKVLNFNYSLLPQFLQGGNLQFNFSYSDDISSNADRNTIAYVRVKYPQNFNLNNSTSYKLLVPQGPQTKALLNITNFNIAASDTALLYDLTNKKRIKVVRNGNTFQALVPNTGSEKLCYLSSTGQINYVSQVTPVNTNVSNFAKFNNFGTPPNNMSDYLIITEKSLMNEVENYKDYRNSSGYNVLLADIDELYDQFSYGIRKHPLSIRNYVKYLFNTFPSPPEYLFIIGKSLTGNIFRNDINNYKNTLVPTFGVPASDNLFSNRILDTLYQPAIATGRLAAKTPEHVSLYLNKVIEYENTQQLAQNNPPDWMKNVLHFGGGGNIAEQNQFAGYLNQYRNVIEDTLFGGYVRTFLKTSTAPIEINQSDSLKTIINNGVSMMTFFGHASGTGFDQSIDNPSEYNNIGKYPFLFANSCFAGDIFTTDQSSSEAFVLIPSKGVIGYLASTAPTATTALHIYARELYDNIGIYNYGNAVGKAIKETIATAQLNSIGNPFIKEVCLVSVLHGDPAIKVNYFSKPDFEITQPSVYFNPYNITSEQDSFAVNIIVKNKARAVSGNYIVEIKRSYPDGITFDTYYLQAPANKFKDTLTIYMPVLPTKSIGINKLSIRLDLYNQYDEITKLNNVIEKEFLITSSDIIPVYPAKYAVVPMSTVTLKASTGNPFASQTNFIFQIDTTDLFDSPFLKSGNVTHSGGVVSWTPPFTFSDSTVYFWRVAIDNGQNNWRESSFQYIQNKTGWGQAHYFQFKDNNYQYVKYNRPDLNYAFVNSVNVLSVQTSVYQSGSLPWDENWFKINGSVMDIWSCLWDWGNGLKFAVFNPISGEPWMSYNVVANVGPYNNVHCKAYSVPAFDFYTHTNSWRQRVKNFIDSVPVGYHILAYNHNNHNAQSFDTTLYQAFESFGSANIRNLQDNTPYIIFGKKGNAIGFANEVIGGSYTSVINLTDSITTIWNIGHIKSELIGPASKWKSIHWRYNSVEPGLADSVRLCVIGVKIDGQQDTLFSGISSDSLDIYNLSTFIDPLTYPYLYLVAFMRDDSFHTPAQMTRWHVLYDGVPETALNPSLHFTFHKDTLKEGENLKFSCAIQNIGDFDMDSLLVAYWVMDKDRNIHPVTYPRQAPHPVGHILIDTVSFSTEGLAGLNSFWIEVNPNFDQIEQYRFNNIGYMPFFVENDKINPLLDVTFDGVHILDGDIVSADPEISIMLRDENKFLPVDDTSAFRVYLKKPGILEPVRIYFETQGVEQMRFFPATLPENVSYIEYKPGQLPDGIYQLIVQGKDASNNLSGSVEHKISFKVINKPTITEVLNWPNPFTTATHFVFTLTGSEIPTYLKIQIMTITGHVVREIDISELGPIHVGRNITQFVWDGTDTYGDRLANGVYLYRVIAKINDTFIEKNVTSASKYFNQEFGKMYLMR
ncbi:MAG: C25 family cysteine peptidase [Bacteroidales bacterium]|nr:C25 family cysteine peptidase [Bacteroidales bacterium]